MIPEEIALVLAFIVDLTQGKEVNWAVGGSCALALNGIDVKPKDVDIITDREGAYFFDEALREYSVKPVEFREGERFASYFGRFLVNGVEVEVSGNLKVRNEKGEHISHFLDYGKTISFASFLRRSGCDEKLLKEVVSRGFLLPRSLEGILKLIR